ncbi:MAG: hypothetical protein LBD02_01645 [Christensenellaceae bacterium]|jgi:hypothetical protein|nr:hypothetical protein [Christensenellaceae bacterium]
MANGKNGGKPTVKSMIEEAVNAGLMQGRLQASSTAKDAYKATERRLYAIPVLKKKVDDDKDKLEEILTHGAPERSKSIVRFQRTGYRVSLEDMLEALIKDLRATIAADEYEIETVEHAMSFFVDDPFYPAVTGKYIDGYDDEDIAVDLECGTTQVWKQRSRIVRNIAIMLYGAPASS